MGEKLPLGKTENKRRAPLLSSAARAGEQRYRPAPREVGLLGFSTNISRHLGSNGLHRFSVYIIRLWNITFFTLKLPLSSSQMRRLDSGNSSEGHFPWCKGPVARVAEAASVLDIIGLAVKINQDHHHSLKLRGSSRLFSVDITLTSVLISPWLAYCSQGLTPKPPL